jgi:NCS1 family nucleobase:cation symporter-1
MALFAFIASAVTLATVPVFGTLIDNPVTLLSKLGGTAAILALFVLAIATLTTNLAANVVAPANGFSNINPKKISFKMGGYITAGLGIAIFPWKILDSAGDYIFTWLGGYSALLGPIAGILIVDYFWVRRTQMKVDDLYRRDGRYRYGSGTNAVAVIALILGVLPNIPGYLAVSGFVDSVPWIFKASFDFAWFIGFFISGLIYAIVMGRKSPQEA